MRTARPFVTCDNTLLLAEGHGIGTTDLKRIEVRGVVRELALANTLVDNKAARIALKAELDNVAFH